MRAFSRAVRGRGTVYLTGGASALLVGWRASTNDIDLSFDPEPAGTFEAIARLKNELDLNVELAAPDHFVPRLQGWEDRSPLVEVIDGIEWRHYDFRTQALSKLARAAARDLGDVRAMLEHGLVDEDALRRALVEARPGLARFPRLEPEALEAALARVLEGSSTGPEDE